MDEDEAALIAGCRVLVEAGEHSGQYGFLKSFKPEEGWFVIEVEKRAWPKFWLTYPSEIYVEPKDLRILEGFGGER